MNETSETSGIRLPALLLPGLRPTSLGRYLATLGVFRVMTRKWPKVRLAWREGAPCLAGGPTSIEELLGEAVECARTRAWASYELGWQEEQKKDTKAKSGENLGLWRASAQEAALRKFDAHVVATRRLFFNPLLGSGGNAGRRNFARGWKAAVEALAKAAQIGDEQPSLKNQKRKNTRKQDSLKAKEIANPAEELYAWLNGKPTSWLVEKLAAASWFSEGGEQYNSGQSPSREGQISPWAMTLACEGLDFFAGGSSRRLGARTRSFGAFPFVTTAAAPNEAGEAGRDKGEIWVPIWARPTTLAEIHTIFARGRAEVGAKGATTPAAFSAAILRRGVDAGLTGFVRFALGATTSANTFEPRLVNMVTVPHRGISRERPGPNDTAPASLAAGAAVIQRILELWETLPRDTQKGGRWQFRGLRGPMESAIVSLAEKPEELERARALTDTVVAALDRVDRNRSFRKAHVRWRPLPLAWLPVLFGEDVLIERRLAAALITSFPVEMPFASYRFGIEVRSDGTYAVPAIAPARWVWSGGSVVADLVRVLKRRALDILKDEHTRRTTNQKRRSGAVREGWPVRLADLDAWLKGAVDEDLFTTWLGRLALFDWRWPGARPAASLPHHGLSAKTATTSALALHALFLPFLDRRPLVAQSGNYTLSEESGARTAVVAQKLVAQLSAGRVEDAFELARSRYTMAHTPLVDVFAPFIVEDSSRLTASLLIPISDAHRAQLITYRWLRPSRRKGESTHVHN